MLIYRQHKFEIDITCFKSHKSACTTITAFICHHIPEAALIIYVSRGLLSSLTEAKDVLDTIAQENGRLEHRVIISTFAVVDGESCYLVIFLHTCTTLPHTTLS